MISVIIPVYNVALYIEECISSVLNQRYRNFEVLLIDDCGSDNSMELVRDILGGKDDAVIDEIHFRVLHHKQNRGLSAARNTGIDAAAGEYVYFLDSDDTITSDCLYLLAQKAKDTGADVVEGMGNGYGERRFENLPDYVAGKDSVLSCFYGLKTHNEAWDRLVRRSLLREKKIYFAEGMYHEDLIWSVSLFNNAESLAFSKVETYSYCQREGSIMSPASFAKVQVQYNTIITELVKTAHQYGQDQTIAFQKWLTYHVAVFFRRTETYGTREQEWDFYRGTVRKYLCLTAVNKDTLHLLFPPVIGYYVYRRFIGRQFV